jgi:hypothetical protein
MSSKSCGRCLIGSSCHPLHYDGCCCHDDDDDDDRESDNYDSHTKHSLQALKVTERYSLLEFGVCVCVCVCVGMPMTSIEYATGIGITVGEAVSLVVTLLVVSVSWVSYLYSP